MAGGGGGGEVNNEITFNDTSEFVYRNSSTRRGGFEGVLTGGRVDTDLDISGTEDVVREQEEMTEADRVLLRDNIATLTACAVAQLCPDKATLGQRSDFAWDRAITLFPDLRMLLDAEIEDLREDTRAYICLWENQWARTAGSSHNSLVLDLKNRAVTELSRRIAGIIAERLHQYKQHETEAITQAFMDSLNARMQPTQIAYNHIGTLYGILRGSATTNITDRGYTEGRDERATNFQGTGKFFHDVTDISDASGNYDGELNDLAGAADVIAIAVPTA